MSKVDMKQLEAALDDLYQPEITDMERNDYQGINQPVVYLNDVKSLLRGNDLGLDSPDDKQRVGASPSSSPFTDILKAYASINDDELGEDKFDGHHDIQRAEAAIKAAIAEAIGEDEPKVTKRRGFYPPYQPQVEQHRRSGRNQLRAELRRKLGITKEQ